MAAPKYIRPGQGDIFSGVFTEGIGTIGGMSPKVGGGGSAGGSGATTKGNLRKFTMQRFRCVKCNAKYRRMPLSGICKSCKSNRIIYTISEGSIKKYLGKSLDLIEVAIKRSLLFFHYPL